MSVKNCGLFEARILRDEFPVVSTSSTTGLLPEPVEGSSGDFSLVHFWRLSREAGDEQKK
jgi:hypothetical protein